MSGPKRYLTDEQQRDVLAALDAQEAGQNGSRPRRLTLWTTAELGRLPEPDWLVEPFIPCEALVVLFGPSGGYKSFVALSWAARAPGTAVYVAAEGSPGATHKRAAAWEAAAQASADVLWLPEALNLLDRQDVAALAAAIQGRTGETSLIVIDTAARSMVGDENATSDMSRLIAGVDELRRELECAVLLVHHTGHQNTDRERGSSALRGAADVSIWAKPAGPLRVRLECKKARDTEPFEPVVVRLEPVEGSLVAATSVDPLAAIREDVAAYLAEHPDASQREVEQAVTGYSRDVRAAYKEQVRLVRRDLSRTPGHSAARPPSLKGPHPQPHDPTLDPDEHARVLEDGGW